MMEKPVFRGFPSFLLSFPMGAVMRIRAVGWLACAAVGLMSCGLAGPARAVNAAELLVPQTAAERHGLTRAWFAQMPVGGRSRITDIVLDEGTLFVQTSAAMLHAIDAET